MPNKQNSRQITKDSRLPHLLSAHQLSDGHRCLVVERNALKSLVGFFRFAGKNVEAGTFRQPLQTPQIKSTHQLGITAK